MVVVRAPDRDALEWGRGLWGEQHRPAATRPGRPVREAASERRVTRPPRDRHLRGADSPPEQGGKEREARRRQASLTAADGQRVSVESERTGDEGGLDF